MKLNYLAWWILAIGALLVLSIYQGIKILPESPYNRAIEQGGEWFVHTQNEDFLYYEYNYMMDGFSPENHSLRELGALWAITEIADFTSDEKYNRLAKKGFTYFEETLMEDEENNFMYINITPDKIKLGYNAFMILSLMQIDSVDDVKKEILLEQLANGILYQQNEDGSLNTFFYSERDTGVDYYPGQALLALMELYKEDYNLDYLDAVEKAFPYYSGYRHSNPNSAFVPWQTRAFYEYYKVTKDPQVKDYIFSMNDFYLKEYDRVNPCQSFRFNRGIVTAVQMESVTKAYELARKVADKERAQCYSNFVKEAANYIIKLQISNEERYNNRALWWFRGNRNDPMLRVDRNQHAVMALMDGVDAGILK